MRFTRSLASKIALGAAAMALLSPFALAQDDTYRGPGAVDSPGTYEGSRAIQEREQQQDQQYREQQQEQFNQGLEERQREDQQQRQQYYGSQGSPYDGTNGPYAAIYLEPRSMKEWGDWNFPSPQSARAAAQAACHKGTGAPCVKALEFANTCAAVVVSKASHVWAARAASSEALAEDMALTACRKEGGKDCVTRQHYCSPNSWQ